MLFHAPKYKKYLKKHLIYIKNTSKTTATHFLKYGSFGLKCLEGGYITPQQIETVRRIFSRNIKKNLGQYWLCTKPNMPKTKKPNEMRMGKGKGPIKIWYLPVYPGTILFEISGISYAFAFTLLLAAARRISVKTSIISV